MNNVGVRMMAYYMPIYPVFLLYGTTFFYTIMFLFTELVIEIYYKMDCEEIRDRWSLNRNKSLICITIALGIFTSLNGVFSQSALPFIDPLITSVIVQISAPITWLFYPLILRKKYELGQIGCFLLIFGGLIFASVYSYKCGSGNNTQFSNSAFWIFITILSAIPISFETIFQEVAYDSLRNIGGPSLILIILVYYNLVSLVVYFFWIFITTNDKFGTCVSQNYPLDICQINATACHLNQIFPQQWDAISCFFGNYDVNCCGGYQATLWATIFTVGYYIYFVSGALILKDYGSNTWTNINTVLVPLTSICFWIEPIVGQFYSHFEWWILVALISTMIGTILYEFLEHHPMKRLAPKCIPWYNRRYEINKSINDDVINIQEEKWPLFK